MIKHEYSKSLPHVPTLGDLQRIINDATSLGIPLEARVSFGSWPNSTSLNFTARWETITEQE